MEGLARAQPRARARSTASRLELPWRYARGRRARVKCSAYRLRKGRHPLPVPAPASTHLPGAPRPRSGRGRRERGLPAFAALLLVLLTSLAPPPPGGTRRGGSSEVTEHEVKASMLRHFLSYTEWPAGTFASETEPIRLLVVGKDPFGKVLDDALTTKKIGQRSVVIERTAKLPEHIGAHAVFCGVLEPEQRLALIDLVAGRPLLLVGETPGFAADGACVNFFFEGTKVRFEVNPEATRSAGLSLSSEMLKVATLVKSRRR